MHFNRTCIDAVVPKRISQEEQKSAKLRIIIEFQIDDAWGQYPWIILLIRQKCAKTK